MKKYIVIVLLAAVAGFTWYGCEDRSELTAPAVNTGSVSFSRLVSLGNSITAGYQSGAVYESAQKYSFGAQLAKQVGATYAFPNYSDPGTGGRIEVKTLTPFATKINTATGTPTNSTYAAPYNNLGVPGAFVWDILNATSSTVCFQSVNGGGANPMFDLVLRNSALNLGSPFKQAKAQSPTLLTVWIGNNDILGYATAGGTRPFTPTATFTALYNAMADSLAALGTKVVLANIPDVTVIPFFTTVGGQLQQAGLSSVWVVRGTGDTVAVALSKNLLTLSASSLMYDVSGNPTGIGTAKAKPFPSSVVLDSAEIVAAKTATASFNATILAAATAKGFAHVDINGIFNQYAAATATGGKVVDGVKFSVVYVTGGLFSLDGVHPSNQGASIIANAFIDAINAKWSAAIPKINVATVPGGLIFGKEVRFSNIGIPIFPAGSFDNLKF